SIDSGNGGAGIGSFGSMASGVPLAGNALIASGVTINGGGNIDVTANQDIVVAGTLTTSPSNYIALSPYTGTLTITSSGNVSAGDYVSVNTGGAVTINGRLSAGTTLDIYADGGDILLGSTSQLSSGQDMTLVAWTGGSAAGNVIQQAGGSIVIGSGTGSSVSADGDAILAGTIQLNGATPLSISAGGTAAVEGLYASSPSTIGIQAGNNVQIGLIVDAGGQVAVQAGYSILDDNGAGALNILAGTIDLVSQNGAPSPGMHAIDLDTAATTSLAAAVSTGSYGGIAIRNWTAQPASIVLADASGSGFVNYMQYGDFALTSGDSFAVSAGDLLIFATGSLSYNSGASLTASGSIILSAGANLDINSALSSSGALALTAGGTLTINSPVSSYNGGILLSGGNIDVEAPVEDMAAAGYGDIAIMTTGDFTAGTTAGSGAYLMSANNSIYTLSLDALYGGATATATLTTASGANPLLSGIGGNLSLVNGAFFEAGGDISLAFSGGGSQISLTGAPGYPSYMLAGTAGPGTISLAFNGRASGGVVIDGAATTTSASGGSGFFIGDLMTPAVDGSTLLITYGAAQNPVMSSVIGSLNNTTTNPGTSDSTSVTDLIANTLGSTTGGTSSTGETTGGGTDQFGGTSSSDEDKDKTGSTSGSNQDENKPAEKKPVGRCNA
ncbi:MAG TPA: hypothetical protein VF816_18400, partial [Rhodocyclaceae bacterium]